MGLRNTKKILALSVLALVSLSPVFGKDIIKITSNSNHLQHLIDNAKENTVIIIPKGIYKEPIEIRKPLTLKGTSAEDCILDVASEKPVILIETKGEVILENVAVK